MTTFFEPISFKSITDYSALVVVLGFLAYYFGLVVFEDHYKVPAKDEKYIWGSLFLLSIGFGALIGYFSLHSTDLPLVVWFWLSVLTLLVIMFIGKRIKKFKSLRYWFKKGYMYFTLWLGVLVMVPFSQIFSQLINNASPGIEDIVIGITSLFILFGSLTLLASNMGMALFDKSRIFIQLIDGKKFKSELRKMEDNCLILGKEGEEIYISREKILFFKVKPIGCKEEGYEDYKEL